MWDALGTIFWILAPLYLVVGFIFMIQLNKGRSQFSQLGMKGKIFICLFWWLWFFMKK